MSPEAAAAAAAAAVLMAAFALARPASPATKRLIPPAGAPSSPDRWSFLDAVGKRFPRLTAGAEPVLAAAGFESSRAARTTGARLMGALVGSLLGLTAGPGAPILSPALAAAGWWLPLRRVRAAGRARLRALAAALPDAVDLLAACTLGGVGMAVALERVAGHTPGPLGEELRRMLRSLEVGMSRQDALRALAARNPCEETALLAMHLSAAERFGAPVAASLAEIAGELRAARLRRAEEESRKAPVKMLFPLVFLILPAYMCIAVIPLLLDIFAAVRF